MAVFLFEEQRILIVGAVALAGVPQKCDRMTRYGADRGDRGETGGRDANGVIAGLQDDRARECFAVAGAQCSCAISGATRSVLSSSPARRRSPCICAVVEGRAKDTGVNRFFLGKSTHPRKSRYCSSPRRRPEDLSSRPRRAAQRRQEC